VHKLFPAKKETKPDKMPNEATVKAWGEKFVSNYPKQSWAKIAQMVEDWARRFRLKQEDSKD
jgi:hypothetical protein